MPTVVDYILAVKPPVNKCVLERGRDRVRERGGHIETDENESGRVIHTQKGREGYSDREREKEKETETESERERERESAILKSLSKNRIRCSFLLSSKSVKTCIVTYSSIHRIQADYQSFT